MNVEIISASAGSGKTYRLSVLLEEALSAGAARPEGVLATTFTRKAAAELQERVRSWLMRQGRVAEAHRLGAARFGTVNSVCQDLLTEFAFEAGIAPELRILDEESAALMLREALSRVVSPAAGAELAELADRFSDFKWPEAVRFLVEQARANRIDAAALERCGRRSCEGLLSLLGPPPEPGRPERSEGEASRPPGDEHGEPSDPPPPSDPAALDAALQNALRRFVAAAEAGPDETKTTREAVELARGFLQGGLPWKDWAKLCGLKVGKKSEALAEPLRTVARQVDRHPRLRRDLERAVNLVFKIAADALQAYDEARRAAGVVDFVDQELLALDLLEHEAVRERLSGELDLVLVDEFQDTSPIQLVLFLRLAKLARRSVWVGDQKQAIFGFRGTDPQLMDAAIEALLKGAAPETLDTSYRSVPALVDVTSELFARAFAADPHGMDPRRVRLQAHAAPSGQPALEYWELAAGRSNRAEAAALADALQQFLADPDARVRDRGDGSWRRPGPGDLAVLCRTHVQCTEVAGALKAAGRAASVPRRGLMLQPEALLAAAGLRLWVDPKDRLAAAEIARWIAWPDREESWLEHALASGGDFSAEEAVQRLLKRRAAAPAAGAVAALDHVLEALAAREACLGWGDAPLRQANLDALRAHAVRYADACEAEGRAGTVTGLLARFQALRAADADEQAVRADGEAVTVSTWHAAKGLEWPVAILYGMSSPREPSPFGVQVCADAAVINLDDPLAGRWIRYWPNPFHGSQSGTPFHERADASPEAAAGEERERKERLRLLYVGWTRARDRLVIADRPTCFNRGMLTELADADGPLLSAPPEVGAVRWAGVRLDVVVRKGVGRELSPVAAEPGAGYVAAGPRAHPPAFVAPTALDATGRAGAPERIGERLLLTGRPKMDDVGQAVHGFLAADDPARDVAERRALARGLIERWRVEDALSPAELLQASKALRDWVAKRWPEARMVREAPVFHRRDDGTVLRGRADLVLETADGFVVVDHKTFPGSESEAMAKAAGFAGQLAAYAEALRAAHPERPVAGTYVHLPVAGMVIPVTAS